jgi:penicillin V acylase-like amidase (Ntn superfamily)
MIKRQFAALVGFGLAVLIASPVLSCTTVCLLEKEKAFVAYNYDFHSPDGLLLVNKRGTKRVSVVRSQGAIWTSNYGSVTFNQFGRDNPMTGINEKGLVVAQMWLDETRYPPADARPAIGILEWIQYNLDRHASVAEVVAQSEAVRPTSRYPIHYLVADPTGDSATLEFLDEKLVIHRGATMPVRALANSTYADSIAAFEKARGNGVMPATVSSIDRFVRAAMLAGQGSVEPIARGFEILASVAQPDFTRWSVVYDLRAREVHFRTDGNQAIRRLALAGLDFSCGAPVKMLDIASGSAGDVGGVLLDYTAAANRTLIESAFTKTPFLREVPSATKDTLAAHPSVTSSCTPAS